jgi:hypothetical protein
MQLFKIVFERLPMVWVLLGLLFNALGLYLGFEYKLAFVYMIVGWFCVAYGVAVYALQRLESKSKSTATRLSRNFISAGDTTAIHAMPGDDRDRAPEQADPQDQPTM